MVLTELWLGLALNWDLVVMEISAVLVEFVRVGFRFDELIIPTCILVQCLHSADVMTTVWSV